MTLWEATALLEAAPLEDTAALLHALDERDAALARGGIELQELQSLYDRGQRILLRWRLQRAQWAMEAAASAQEREVYRAFTRA